MNLAKEHIESRETDKANVPAEVANELLKDIWDLVDEFQPCLKSHNLMTFGKMKDLHEYVTEIVKLGRGAKPEDKKEIFDRMKGEGKIASTCKFNPRVDFRAGTDYVRLC